MARRPAELGHGTGAGTRGRPVLGARPSSIPDRRCPSSPNPSSSATGRCTACGPRRRRSSRRWPSARRRSRAGPGRSACSRPRRCSPRWRDRLRGTGIRVGAQDCHEHDTGAFTGEISALMVRDAGAAAVLVGHSERRHGLGETDDRVRAKAEAALACGLVVVLCIGETEAEWLAGETLERLAAPARRQPAARGARAAPDRRLRAGLGHRHRPECQQRRHRAEPRACARGAELAHGRR